MKVILLKDVKKLGQKGDVVDVAEGYGRNFLIPKGFAQLATEGGLKQVEEIQAREEAKAKKQLEQAKKTGEKIAGKVVEITTKAGETGRLFGSVTNNEISAAIKTQYGVKIDRRRIELREGIKSLGDHQVKIKIHPQVNVEMVIRVVSQ